MPHFLVKAGSLPGVHLAAQWLCLRHTEHGAFAMFQNENGIFIQMAAAMRGKGIWLQATDQTCGVCLGGSHTEGSK